MMHVVDTNVAIVANGRTADTERMVSPACRLAAVSLLQDLLARGRIALDLNGSIQAEYHSHLNPRGQPGVGDRFYLAVLNSAPDRIHREYLEIGADGSFVDFPASEDLKNFDLSDRKFAALARKLGIPVANAVDSDWKEHQVALSASGIEVQFLCGEDCDVWFAAE